MHEKGGEGRGKTPRHDNVPSRHRFPDAAVVPRATRAAPSIQGMRLLLLLLLSSSRNWYYVTRGSLEIRFADYERFGNETERHPLHPLAVKIVCVRPRFRAPLALYRITLDLARIDRQAAINRWPGRNAVKRLQRATISLFFTPVFLSLSLSLSFLFALVNA